MRKYGIWLILGFALLLYLALAFTYVGNDEASYVYDAKLILEKQIPYRDFVTRALPQIYLYAFFMNFFGASLYTAKIVNVLICVGTVYVIYLIGKLLLNRETGLIAAIFYLICPVTMLVTIPTSTSILNVLLVALGMYFFMKSTNDSAFRNLFLSGLFISLGFLTRMFPALYLLPLALVLLFYNRAEGLSSTLKKLSCFILGFLTPTAIFGGYLAFYTGMITTLKVFGMGIAVAEEALIPLSSSIWVMGVSAIFSMYLLLLFALFVIHAAHVYFSEGRKIQANVFTTLVWFFFTGAFYSWYVFKRGFFFTYYFDFVPPICLISALFFVKFNMLSRITTKVVSYRKIFNVALLFIVFLSLFSIHIRPFSDQRGVYTFQEFLGSGVSFETVNRVSDYIRIHTDPEDEILAGSLQWLVQADRRQMLDISHPLIYEEGTTVYEQYPTYTPEDIIDYFESHPIEYVIVDGHFHLGFWYLEDIVSSKYVMVEDIDGIEIYRKI